MPHRNISIRKLASLSRDCTKAGFRADKRCIALLAVLLLTASPAYSATYTWTGDGNNAWGDTNNWDIGATPGGSDDVIYYDNPFSGNSTYAGLNNSATGSVQRFANSITFASTIGSVFALYPRGDTTTFNPPDHYVTLYGGGFDAQTTSTITLNIDVDLGSNQSWNVVPGGTLIAAEQVRGSARLTQTGTGTLELNGANTYTGGTYLSTVNGPTAGTISLGHITALGTNRFDFQAGGTLALGISGLSINNHIFVGNRTDTAPRVIQLDLAGTNTGTLSTIDIRQGGANRFVIDVGDSDTLTVSGTINTGAGGGAGLSKNGAGTLILNGTNTYSSGTKLNAGTLIVGNNEAISSGTLTLNGGTLRTQSTAVTLNEATVVAGTAAMFGGGANITLSGAISGSGTFVVGGSGSGQTSAFASILDDLSGFSGTLRHDNVTGLSTLLFSSGDVNTTAKLETTGNSGNRYIRSFVNMTFGELSGTGGKIIADNKFLTINQSTDTSYAGQLSNVNNNRTLGFTKSGSGTLTLTHTSNDYQRQTTFNGGTLAVEGGITQTPSITLNNNGSTLQVNGAGSLGSSGTYAGNITANNASAFEYNSTTDQELS